MSELTICNYCTFKECKKMARQKRMKLSKISTKWGLGGVDIVMHPKDVKAEDIKKDKALRDKYFLCWFMDISDSCCC